MNDLTRVKNSTNFAEEAREWSIVEDEIQVSYDVVNLYPSVPIGRSIKVVMDLVSDIMTKYQKEPSSLF